MSDQEPAAPLRIHIAYDHDREVSLYDVGGDDYRLVVAVARVKDAEFEFFVVYNESEETLTKAVLFSPEHEAGGLLPEHYQRRINLVTRGSHCCGGRTRNGALCALTVKTAGMACRWHAEQNSTTDQRRKR
ncbi:MAG: hypothetical protein WD118_05745 [Phycisphaeraceae bacterium]